MNHLALVLLLPAALLTWRWSRLVSAALALALLAGIAFLLVPHQAWTLHDGEWRWTFTEGAYRLALPGLVGLAGAVVLAQRITVRQMLETDTIGVYQVAREGGGSWDDIEVARVAFARGRPDALAALLVVSMGVDLAALLLHRGTGQWGPQPFFQCAVLLAICAVSVKPRRKT
jgi:hypothetical protein